MNYKKYKRVFMIVMDSLGIGAMKDAHLFNDEGTNTFKHTSIACNGLNIPTLNSLGLYDLDEGILGASKVSHKHSYSLKANEISKPQGYQGRPYRR